MFEFFIENNKVDVKRLQITTNGQTRPIEPKVLQVLMVLVEHQGQVVTHETILSRVWPDVVVAPNAVQRCIGVLRKLLQDDAKSQRVIATQPKVGYRLVVAVNDAEVADKPEVIAALNPQSQPQPQPKTRPITAKWLFIAVVFCLTLIVLYQFKSAPKPPPISRLTPVTNTDEKEYYPNYSPDGRYLVYNRYVSACDSHIWIKDLTNGQEFKLTKNASRFGGAAWSPDGQQLAFSSANNCPNPQTNNCRDISILSVPLAKADEQIPTTLKACGQMDYLAIIWLSNNEIAFIAQDAQQVSQEASEQIQVKSLSIDDGTTKTLVSDKTRTPVALTYSTQTAQLAITTHDINNGSGLSLLDVDNGELTHVKLKVPAQFADSLKWDPSWHPSGNHLLAGAGRSLYKISLDGHFTEYPVATLRDIYNPMYHPDGNSITATLGVVDFDIGLYQFKSDVSGGTTAIVQRSNVQDYYASYRPGTDDMAFVSQRSGQEQIWFAQQQLLTQLSQFTAKEQLDAYLWSNSGNLIATAVSGRLQLLSINKEQQLIDTPFYINNIFQWLDGQRMLLAIKDSAKHKVVIFNISNGSYETVHEGFSEWAQLTTAGELYFFESEKQLMVHSAKGVKPILNPLHQGKVDNFVYKDKLLVILYDDKSIWTLKPLDGLFSAVLVVDDDNDFFQVTDIDLQKGRLLFNTITSTAKELVTFHN